MSGWGDSDRKERLPENWEELRRARLDKDGWRCTAWLPKSRKRCPRPATDVDHHKPGDDHRIENLRSLCATHHGKKSAREGNQARRAKQAARYRPAEKHPGLL